MPTRPRPGRRLDEHLNEVLDVTARLNHSGDILRVDMGAHATPNQPARVERAIEQAGYQVVGRRRWPRGEATYQVRPTEDTE